jgi:C1A family cysteine protease
LKGDPLWVDNLPAKVNVNVKVDLPEEFDARSNWPSCKSLIGLVRDQSHCGSCWVFGTTGAFNDRYCIHIGAKTILSTADTMSCAPGNGCEGGQPSDVWKWFVSSGVCSGGLSGDTTTCKPYPYAPCSPKEFRNETRQYPPCPSYVYPTPPCRLSCDISDLRYTKYKAQNAYALSDEQSIMDDIYKNGPVAASYQVFSDFTTYKRGVYHKGTSPSIKLLGSHNVKIIGWGNQNPGGPYWLVVNSWGAWWGDHGLFKISRGSNMCGIEEDVTSGLPSQL